MGRRKVFEPMRDETIVRTWTDLLKVVENELGWCPAWDDPRPNWKVRATEVSKLKAVIKKLERENSRMKGKYTVENLLITVEYLKREKELIKSPVYLAYACERALAWHHDARLDDLEARVERAKASVRSLFTGPERQRWLSQLTRARGEPLVELLDELEAVIT